MKTNRLILTLALVGAALASVSCSSGGGDSATPTDPATVFQLFPSGYFTAGYTETTSYTGSDTLGGTYTAIFSIQTQPQSTFLGVPAIPILGQLQMTNTSTGAFASVISTSYYTPLATDRHYLGYSNSAGTTTVSSTTTAIPETAKIGNFGVIGTYTDNAGDVDVQSWRIDDGGNGNADVVQLSTETDQFGSPITSSTSISKTDVNGNTLSYKLIIFYFASGETLTLVSN